MNRLKLVAAALAGALVASVVLVSTGFASREAVTPRQQQIAAAKMLNLCTVILRFENQQMLPLQANDPNLIARAAERGQMRAACLSTVVWPAARARFGG